MKSKQKQTKFAELEGRIEMAVEEMTDALAIAFPMRSRVWVTLNCRQIIPSEAEVIGYAGIRGAVCVRLMKSNRKGDRFTADVHWLNVESDDPNFRIL